VPNRKNKGKIPETLCNKIPAEKKEKYIFGWYFQCLYVIIWLQIEFILSGGKIMSKPKIITFKIHHDEFYFLGIENLVTENSDFGAFWGNFFDKGGYEKIDLYQKDPNCINVWYNKTPEEKIYYQGKIVNEVDKVPDGYTLAKFPASEYLVTTTEWLSSYDESMQHINHSYYKSAQMPEGYTKCGSTDNKIFLIERWGADTGDGYRYEFWVPIKKVD
jgi:predicted transcriptional regulator YdeE